MNPELRTKLAKRLFEVMDSVRNKPVSAKFAAAERFLEEAEAHISKTRKAPTPPAKMTGDIVSVSSTHRSGNSHYSISTLYANSVKQTSSVCKGGVIAAESPSHGQLLAAIEAIDVLIKIGSSSQKALLTDSEFVVNGLARWIKGWEANGWINSQKQPVAHKNDWLNLKKMVEEMNISVSLHVAAK